MTSIPWVYSSPRKLGIPGSGDRSAPGLSVRLYNYILYTRDLTFLWFRFTGAEAG